MFIGNVAELFLPIPIYFVGLVGGLCVHSFRRRGRAIRRWRFVFLAVFVWSWFFASPGCSKTAINRLEDDYPAVVDPPITEDPLIVVLSSGYMDRVGKKWEPRLDLAGWERTHAGIRLWKRIGGTLLFVGQPTPSERGSVAAVMAEVAKGMGVPDSAVRMEELSRTTHENLAFSREAILAHGKNVWLVTSAIHMPRAMAVARAKGLEVMPYPCDYRGGPTRHWTAWFPNTEGPELFANALHELIGIAYYRVRGRAD